MIRSDMDPQRAGQSMPLGTGNQVSKQIKPSPTTNLPFKGSDNIGNFQSVTRVTMTFDRVDPQYHNQSVNDPNREMNVDPKWLLEQCVKGGQRGALDLLKVIFNELKDINSFKNSGSIIQKSQIMMEVTVTPKNGPEKGNPQTLGLQTYRFGHGKAPINVEDIATIPKEELTFRAVNPVTGQVIKMQGDEMEGEEVDADHAEEYQQNMQSLTEQFQHHYSTFIQLLTTIAGGGQKTSESDKNKQKKEILDVGGRPMSRIDEKEEVEEKKKTEKGDLPYVGIPKGIVRRQIMLLDASRSVEKGRERDRIRQEAMTQEREGKDIVETEKERQDLRTEQGKQADRKRDINRRGREI